MISAPYVAPRTFGDLIPRIDTHGCSAWNVCAFCKRMSADIRPDNTDHGLVKYSTRHYICRACIEPRKFVVLPRVRRAELHRARVLAAGARVTP